jgi:hypothetical protein
MTDRIGLRRQREQRRPRATRHLLSELSRALDETRIAPPAGALAGACARRKRGWSPAIAYLESESALARSWAIAHRSSPSAPAPDESCVANPIARSTAAGRAKRSCGAARRSPCRPPPGCAKRTIRTRVEVRPRCRHSLATRAERVAREPRRMLVAG